MILNDFSCLGGKKKKKPNKIRFIHYNRSRAAGPPELNIIIYVLCENCARLIENRPRGGHVNNS